MYENRDFTKFTPKELIGMKVAVYSASPSEIRTAIKQIDTTRKGFINVGGCLYRKDNGELYKKLSYFEEYCFIVTEEEVKQIEKEDESRKEMVELRQKMLNTHSKLTLNQLRLINKIIDNPKSIVFSRTK